MFEVRALPEKVVIEKNAFNVHNALTDVSKLYHGLSCRPGINIGISIKHPKSFYNELQFFTNLLFL